MSNAKVLLLNPPSKHGVAVVRDTFYGCWCKGRAGYNWPPLSLAILGAVLKESDFNVSLLDASGLKWDYEKTISEVGKENPDYIVVNSATITFSSDVEVVRKIKGIIPDVKVIFLGTHVTALPERTMDEKAIDFIILGEPDLVLRDMIIELEKGGNNLGRIRGIGYRENGKVVITGKADPIMNLDELPFADRSLIPDAEYFNPFAERLPYTTMLTSRGCPFKCIYCSSVILYGHKFRARSPGNVVDEIEQCLNQGYKEIFFRDETFTFGKKRTVGICKEILDRGLDITWMVNSRVDTVSEETLQWMKKAGCHLIKFGVESGSQEILNNLRKGITIEQTKKAFALCKKYGIETVAHMMFGNPGETEETLKKSIEFVKEIDADYASFNITTPYPGTELWDSIESKMGIKEDFSAYDIEKTLETAYFSKYICDLPEGMLLKYYDKAYRDFYFRPGYILKRMLKRGSARDFCRMAKAGLSLVSFNVKNTFMHKKN